MTRNKQKEPHLHTWLVWLAALVSVLVANPTNLLAQDTNQALPLRSLKPSVLLPDGTEFKTWEQSPRFTKTYYVDARNPAASDQNPGTRRQPFATINRAAQVLQAGERVVVAAGVYRERIRPARGGSSPHAMISYEAAPGAQVILKGSRIFQEPWRQAGSESGSPVWEARLEPRYFAGYNPFDIDNVTSRQFDIMDFAAPLRGKPPCSLPRGLVFQDGKRLTQVVHRVELAAREGAYWVDRTNQVLYVRLFGQARPEQVMLEITTQETVLAPEQMGLGFIRVKGFTVEQVAGPFPWEQVGAISTTRGHHWIIEDNTVRQVNGVGIDVGVQLHRWPQPPLAGFHIVRRNTVSDCGICGIAGMGPGGREFGLLIEDNVLLRNAFHDVERLYETAGIKTHCNVRCLIRHNQVADTVHGPGIWMDWDNRYSRCCQNVIVNTSTIAGGIFVEASQKPNLVDQNIIWDTRGHGIYEHDSFGQIFAHNFIGRSSKSGFHLHGKITDRRIAGKTPDYGRHQVKNNMLYENHDPDFFGGQPSEVTGNLADGLLADLNREGWLFTLTAGDSVTMVPSLDAVTHDFGGAPRARERTAPGPFSQVTRKAVPNRIWAAGDLKSNPLGDRFGR